MEVPQILLQPHKFEACNLQQTLGQKLLSTMKSDGASTFVIAMAQNKENATFLISSVDQSVKVMICSSFHITSKTTNVRAVILSYPNHMTVIDKNGKSPSKSNFGQGSNHKYVPFVWNCACSAVLKARYTSIGYYKDYTYVKDLEDQLESVKKTLADTLLAQENDAATVASLRRELRKAKLCCKKKCATLASKVGALRDSYSELKRLVRDKESNFLNEESASIGNTMVMVTKAAMQCHFYFTHDRYSNEYFQKTW